MDDKRDTGLIYGKRDSGIEDVDRDDLFFELIDAVLGSKVVLVKMLLKFMSPKEVAQLDPRLGSVSYGRSPLHVCRDVQICDMVLSHGPLYVDLLALYDSTPLITSVCYPQVVQFFIDHGANVNHASKRGTTALHQAVLENVLETVQILVASGADVNSPDNEGNTPLHCVGDINIARYLVEHGAVSDKVNQHGNIPLEEAVRHGRCMQVANYLLGVSYQANGTKTQQLLNVLTEHVLGVSGVCKAKDEEAGTIVHVREMSKGSFEEEKAIYETNEGYGAKEKWQNVKSRVLKGKMKLLRLRKKNSTQQEDSEVRNLKRAGFVKRLTSLSKEDQKAQLHFEMSFFELMVKERPEVALKILDKQRIFLNRRHGCRAFAYCLDLIGSPLRASAALKDMVRYERYNLLSHPCVRWYINLKYTVYIKYVLVYEFVMNLLLTVLVAFTYSTQPGHLKIWWDALFGGQVFRNASSVNIGHSFLMVCELCMLYLNFRYIFIYLITWKMAVKPIKGWKNKAYYLIGVGESFHNDVFLLPHIGLYVRCLLQHAYPESRHVNSVAAIISAGVFFMLWYRSITYTSGLVESFGVTIATVRKMAIDTCHYFFVLLLFIFGFSAIMTTMYVDSDIVEFNSMGHSVVTLFFFVFNLDLNGVIDDKFSVRKYSAFLFLGLYMVIVGMILINLIIAVMTNSYEDIKQKAKEQHILTRALIVIKLEEATSLVMQFQEYYISKTYGNTLDWYKWEQENSVGKKIMVKEYPGGKVSIDIKKSWLQFFLTERCSSWFFCVVKFYERISATFSPDGFSWLKLGMKPGKKVKPEDMRKACEEIGIYSKEDHNDYNSIADPQHDTENLVINKEDFTHIGYFVVSERYQDISTAESAMESAAKSMVQKMDKIIEMQQDLTKRVTNIESTVQQRGGVH
eukprot:CAMPEP_0203761080 /NCGR_PEP_ID=MMETSP0098-20131031/14250_1 /ASSEMBLY_ACC=CAM_ASM_000208 /TAXON_ID=96639 /ORGANISM=" , Strain NY0313808BC1" /LENGTH=911 /DNA_ID=CAMNT_0050654925 /DNA_START=165 /DNA_END=2903 /DNA_ORIENTATION=+